MVSGRLECSEGRLGFAASSLLGETRRDRCSCHVSCGMQICLGGKGGWDPASLGVSTSFWRTRYLLNQCLRGRREDWSRRLICNTR